MGKVICQIAGISVRQEDDGRVSYTAGARIDADGANGQSCHPTTGKPLFAYAPGNKGLDDLANAGFPAHPAWYRDILVCDKNGHPEIVYARCGNDPHKQFAGYVSRTAYEDRHAPPNTPARYLDSAQVRYVVVNPIVRRLARGVVLGCKVRVSYLGLSVDAVAGDIGPAGDLGEISIACADALGIDSNARTGGIEKQAVTYELWPSVPAVLDGKRFDLIPA